MKYCLWSLSIRSFHPFYQSPPPLLPQPHHPPSLLSPHTSMERFTWRCSNLSLQSGKPYPRGCSRDSKMAAEPCEEEDQEEEPNRRAAGFSVDGGWSWVVCAAGFLVHFVVSGQISSGGVVYTALMDEFRRPRGETGGSERICVTCNLLTQSTAFWKS